MTIVIQLYMGLTVGDKWFWQRGDVLAGPFNSQEQAWADAAGHSP